MSEKTTSSIRRTSSKFSTTPEQRSRKFRVQVIAGIVLVVLMALLGYYIQSVNSKGFYVLFIGLALGYILQRSRFCFTAAFRDPMLTGTTELTKAVIVGLAAMSVILLAIHIKFTGFGLENLETEKLGSILVTALPGNIRPVGVNILIGGFLFGIGAVIAGGCASGTIMRMGEGFAQSWVAAFTFVLGSGVGVHLVSSVVDVPIFYQTDPLYLPQLLGGWIPTIIIHFGTLFALYVLADWWGKKKSGVI